VTDRRRAEDALAFLNDAGTMLASSLDYETTLTQVARLAVPALADWCAVDIAGVEGSIHRLAVAALDPLKEALVRQLRERYPFRPEWTTGVPQVMRSGEPEIIAQVNESQLAASAQDPQHLALLLNLGMRSILRVPLVARGRTLGVISFISAESGRQYNAADLPLAQALARRAAQAIDNARLYEEAQAALRARDQFFATISHDLRTPLTAIKAFTQILHRRATRTSGDGAAVTLEALTTIDSATTKMMTLISEMLDLSRLQSGRPLELERERTDLLALVRLEVAALQRTVSDHQIAVETWLDELVGDWDSARLGRVISNLVENAVKYSPAGGPILLSVRCEPHDDGLCAVLRVRDEGIGIPADDLPHLFERFHRGANVGRIDGTGVGLSGARQIVEQHGGTITVESTEGSGTTVTVRLPLAASESEPLGPLGHA
jgi:signal transduction histidine kinase